jgi:hypothetical protein
MVGEQPVAWPVLYAKVQIMPKEYARIVCMVGANMRSELRRTELEPLPEPIRELLRRLDERQEGAKELPCATSQLKKLSHKRRRKRRNAEV